MLPTSAAVSSLSVPEVLLTLAGFVALYSTLLVIEIALMIKYIKIGPEDGERIAPTSPPSISAPSSASAIPAE